MRKIKSFLILFILLGSQTTSANIVYEAHTEVELVAEVQSVQPGKNFWVALRMKMDPKWHTYWINPGDSGLATSIEWNIPNGFDAGEIQWPFPEKVPIDPLMGYGYSNEIFLLTEMTAPKNLSTENSVTLSAKVEYLACEIECVPGTADLDLTLPVRDEVPKAAPAWMSAFAKTRGMLPIEAQGWRVEGNANSKSLNINVRALSGKAVPLTEVYFYPFESNLIDHFAQQQWQKIGVGNYRLTIQRSSLFEGDLKEIEGILVSKEGWRGADSERAMRIKVPIEKGGLGTAMALLFAFVGGLILNLMPCVLPVISLKVLHFAQQDASQTGEMRKQGVLFTLGVVASFWALAGILIVFRSLGQQIGWGFHLQSPIFVLLLTFLFLGFAFNLLGFFEIGLSLSGVGGSMKLTKTGASFLSGVLTTIVATPCTAPFMGAALGYGLTQPPAISLLIFTFLGFGMAFPFLLLSFAPGLLKFVPKPGPWMMTLKKVLAMLLFATAGWLVWILTFQVAQKTLLLVLFGLLLYGISLWFYGREQRRSAAMDSKQGNAVLFLSLSVLLALLSVWFLPPPQHSSMTTNSKQGISWEKFSKARLDQLLEEGKPVFLDFTAAWCLTCKVNERIALETNETVARFKEHGIVALKADWTNRDEEITEMLATYGRSSIPLYVLYGPGKKDPVLLPEILSPGIVKEALDDAF